MNKPKRHHFVPEMLSKRFANADGKVFFFDNKTPKLGVRENSPSNLLAETHLYSIRTKNGEWDATLEQLYSKLESAADPILVKLCDATRHRRAPRLSQKEKLTWDEFLYNQWRRVPEVHGRYTNDEVFGKLFNETIEKLEKRRPLSDEERNDLAKPETRERLLRNARIGALSRSSKKVLGTLQGRGIMLLTPNQKKGGFITGSSPVIKLTRPDATELTDPSVELWLALAPDVVAGISPDPGGSESVHGLPPHAVRRLNLALAKQSRFLVGRDRALLESIARPR